jgi:futalosine hydrolase
VRVLVVVATEAEVGPFVAGLARVAEAGPRLTRYRAAAHDVDALITGVGMVATASWCSRILATGRYDVALNLGVCGSFNSSIGPGAVVHVITDRLAELGAEDGDSFLTIQQMGLLQADEFPFKGGRLVNEAAPALAPLSDLRAVDGITVSTVHGNEASIAGVAERFVPDVESMEGAAFMYSCLIHGVPFAQVRAVSNIVERRNRLAWKLQEAVGALGAAGLRILAS